MMRSQSHSTTAVDEHDIKGPKPMSIGTVNHHSEGPTIA